MEDFEQRLRDTLSHAYVIERELGGGGMSRVFVATDRSLGRKIVIKLLSPELTAEVNRGRFRREIQVAAKLQHPHIVPLLSAGEHEDLLYFTMPFIAGESLRSAVEKNGPLSVVEVVRVLYHVSEALDYAHGEGVVHRDIKPANILRSGNYALVTDFGVAKALNASMTSAGMTSTGMAVGTPAYMAPEQLAGDPGADHRIDIYAVGLLAYELLKGKSPFAATTPQKVLAAVLTHDAKPLIEVRPDVPQRLSEIVMSCLEKEPEDRPSSAKELLAALDTFSTASGEIRTMEHRVPRVPRTPQTGTSPAVAEPQSTSARETTSAREPTPTLESEPVEADRPQKSRKQMLVGGLALAVPVAAGAIFFLSQRSGNASSGNAPSPKSTASVAESASVQPQAGALTAAPASLTASAKVDSQAIADSLKRVARAAAAKLAAAKADSLKRTRDMNKSKARGAAIALLADPSARNTFMDGATHMGGVLGKRRMGDLQTQINALQPFLARAGLTYEQFKGIAQDSGINLFDQFGRIVPDSLRQFAGLSRQ